MASHSYEEMGQGKPPPRPSESAISGRTQRCGLHKGQIGAWSPRTRTSIPQVPSGTREHSGAGGTQPWSRTGPRTLAAAPRPPSPFLRQVWEGPGQVNLGSRCPPTPRPARLPGRNGAHLEQAARRCAGCHRTRPQSIRRRPHFARGPVLVLSGRPGLPGRTARPDNVSRRCPALTLTQHEPEQPMRTPSRPPPPRDTGLHFPTGSWAAARASECASAGPRRR